MLTIFQSYVAEDQRFADTIAEGLIASFGKAVDLKYMSQFPLGANFYSLIDAALNATDILLVIATGHEKLSHSFTGYEVGYFRSSQQARPLILGQADAKRLIIPVTLLADIPSTLTAIEGIGITEADRYSLGPEAADAAMRDGDDPFFRLLTRIDDLIDRTDGAERSAERRARDYEGYRKDAVNFRAQLLNAMSSLPVRRDFPKTRLTLRLPACFNVDDDPLDGAGVMVSCNGPTVGIFRTDPASPWKSWRDFERCIGSDSVGLSWNDALRALIGSSLAGDFTDSDQLIFSYDEKRLFRLFVSKSTTFFDGTRELDIYVVEVLRYRDIGDPLTTLLAKALAVGLRYRSLFLETGSPFGPVAFRLCRHEDWDTKISHLQREMRLLLLQSREAALSDRRSLLEIYGSEKAAIDTVVANMTLWNDQKQKLDTAAADTKRDGATDATLDAFLTALTEFCVQTESINASYTTAVLRRLNEVLGKRAPGSGAGTGP